MYICPIQQKLTNESGTFFVYQAFNVTGLLLQMQVQTATVFISYKSPPPDRNGSILQ